MNKLYKDTVVIYRTVELVDSNNETTESEMLIETVNGKLSALTGNKLVRNDRNEIDSNYVLNTEKIDITEKDIIWVGIKKYIVKFVDKTLSNHLEIYLLLIN